MTREQTIAQLCEVTGKRSHYDLLNWLDENGYVSNECRSMDPDNGGPADSDLTRALTALRRDEERKQGQGVLW